MTVYVDNMEAAFGRMKMCHCWADTRDELLAMMDAIGVKRKWFQRPRGAATFGMDASWEHFDIAQTKRALAIQHGAVEVSMFVMAEHADRQKFIAAVADQQRSGALRCVLDKERRSHRGHRSGATDRGGDEYSGVQSGNYARCGVVELVGW